MNDFLHDFVKKAVMKMIGKEPEYQVRLTALGWLEKGVFAEAVADIDAAYEALAAAQEQQDAAFTVEG